MILHIERHMTILQTLKPSFCIAVLISLHSQRSENCNNYSSKVYITLALTQPAMCEQRSDRSKTGIPARCQIGLYLILVIHNEYQNHLKHNYSILNTLWLYLKGWFDCIKHGKIRLRCKQIHKTCGNFRLLAGL